MSGVPAGEFGLIDWIRGRCRAGSGVRLGIGDDCAVIANEIGPDLLVTTDMLMDGRHFRLATDGAEAVGYKALGVNLSDIAAMAGEPVAAFAAVALPRGEAASIDQGLLRGMMPLAERFGVTLAGGDTNAWDGPMVVCITVLGRAVAPGPVTRSGARPGDVVLVTGPLGGSLLGRHLRPEPRIAEAQALLRMGGLRALIDLSDGLSSDLAHILEESGGLGATLDEGAIPIHEDACLMSERDGRSPISHALDDGEDFELCAVVTPGTAEDLIRRPVEGLRVHRVGVIDEGAGIRLRGADGAVRAIARGGFDHLA